MGLPPNWLLLVWVGNLQDSLISKRLALPDMHKLEGVYMSNLLERHFYSFKHYFVVPTIRTPLAYHTVLHHLHNVRILEGWSHGCGRIYHCQLSEQLIFSNYVSSRSTIWVALTCRRHLAILLVVCMRAETARKVHSLKKVETQAHGLWWKQRIITSSLKQYEVLFQVWGITCAKEQQLSSLIWEQFIQHNNAQCRRTIAKLKAKLRELLA